MFPFKKYVYLSVFVWPGDPRTKYDKPIKTDF